MFHGVSTAGPGWGRIGRRHNPGLHQPRHAETAGELGHLRVRSFLGSRQGAVRRSQHEIFKQREINDVRREGTNEIEKTIFIKSPTSVRYGDVVKVIDAAKRAGAEPIGLQIDDLSAE